MKSLQSSTWKRPDAVAAKDFSPRPAGAVVHPITVTWGDCDPARIAYTGRLPWFALDAINGWWTAIVGHGWYHMEIDQNLGTPFVKLNMEFFQPVTPRHELLCHVWPERLGETSIAFRVDGEQDGVLCFSTETVSVFTTADQFTKAKPPQSLSQIIAQHLPKEGSA